MGEIVSAPIDIFKDIAMPSGSNAADKLYNHYESNRQMHFQSDEADEARAFQQDMYNQQKQFQREEREAAQQYYSDEWSRQFQAQSAWQNEQYWAHVNSERQYNSPANQVQLFRQAGINPASVGIGGASGTTFSAPQAISASAQMPSNNAPSPPSVPQAHGGAMPPSTESLASSFAAFTSGFKNMSEAAKTDEEKKRLSSTYEGFMQMFAEQVLTASIERKSKQIELIISEATKDDKIKDAYETWFLKASQAALNGSLSDLNVQKRLTEEFETAIAGIREKITAEEYEQLLVRGKALPMLLQKQMKVYDSEAYKNFEEGNLFGEQRERIKALTPAELEGMRNDVVNGKIKNIKDADAFITALYGDDSLVGSHLKTILRHTSPEDYTKFILTLVNGFEKQVRISETKQRAKRSKFPTKAELKK